MLNQSELRNLLAFVRYLSNFCLLPLQVKGDCWEIREGAKSTWRKLACRTSFGIFSAHTLYKNLSLVFAFVSAADMPLHHMVIHLVLAGTSVMLTFWYYVLFIRYPGINATLSCMTLAGTVAASKRMALIVIIYYSVAVVSVLLLL